MTIRSVIMNQTLCSVAERTLKTMMLLLLILTLIRVFHHLLQGIKVFPQDDLWDRKQNLIFPSRLSPLVDSNYPVHVRMNRLLNWLFVCPMVVVIFYAYFQILNYGYVVDAFWLQVFYICDWLVFAWNFHPNVCHPVNRFKRTALMRCIIYSNSSNMNKLEKKVLKIFEMKVFCVFSFSNVGFSFYLCEGWTRTDKLLKSSSSDTTIKRISYFWVPRYL